MVSVDRGPEILAKCGIMVALALVSAIARLWVRLMLIHQAGWDDYTMGLAAIVVLAQMMIIIPEVGFGAGRHADDLSATDIVAGLHLNFVTQPLCVIALCLTKVSVGLFLLRLTPARHLRRFIWAVMAVTIASATVNFMIVMFQCRPLAFIWDSSVAGGICMSASALKFVAFFNSSVAILTDLTFALLPMPMLWTVQMNWKVKSAVIVALSLGIFATASGLVKVTYLSSYGSHGDFLWDSSDITIWTTFEIGMAMIGANLPCLRPLVKRVFAGSSSGTEAPRPYLDRQEYIRTIGDTTPTGNKKTEDTFQMYGRWPSNTAYVSHGERAAVDNDSEEAILTEDAIGAAGIVKTLEVSVTVSAD